MMREPRDAAPPTMVALMICDQVIDDRVSSKKSAIGLFNMVMVPAVPTRVHQMSVMASLTEITAPTMIQMRLVRDSDNEVVFSTQGRVDAPHPLATVDLIFAMQGLVLPNAGQYAFEILAGQEILGRRRFQVVLPSEPPTTSN
jgi:hypothetical protein